MKHPLETKSLNRKMAKNAAEKIGESPFRSNPLTITVPKEG